jgi:hypothetical protein
MLSENITSYYQTLFAITRMNLIMALISLSCTNSQLDILITKLLNVLKTLVSQGRDLLLCTQKENMRTDGD